MCFLITWFITQIIRYNQWVAKVYSFCGVKYIITNQYNYPSSFVHRHGLKEIGSSVHPHMTPHHSGTDLNGGRVLHRDA